MKIKLICYEKDKEEIKNHLKDVTFTSDGDFILIDKTLYDEQFTMILGFYKDGYEVLNKEKILYFESIKDSIYAHTLDKTFLVKEKLYELELKCMKDAFLRVNKSFIVNVKMIKHIKPNLNRKFILTMENEFKIDVTRTYYESFKNYIGL